MLSPIIHHGYYYYYKFTCIQHVLGERDPATASASCHLNLVSIKIHVLVLHWYMLYFQSHMRTVPKLDSVVLTRWHFKQYASSMIKHSGASDVRWVCMTSIA